MRFAAVELDPDGAVGLREVGVGARFVEGVKGAVAADFLVADVNLDTGRIDQDSAIADGGQDAAPVGVGARPCRFY